jgi:hypothetical protein
MASGERMRRTLSCGAWVLLAAVIAAGATPVLAAAPAAMIEADRSSLVQGLEAQFQVALIRERKLADDRESQALDAAQARLASARIALDASRGDARQLHAALAAARSDLATQAAAITQHDAEAKAELAAYHAEAVGLATQATPEKLAALQRFADGDRVGAWPVIEALTDADDKAVQAGANARRAAGQRPSPTSSRSTKRPSAWIRRSLAIGWSWRVSIRTGAAPPTPWPPRRTPARWRAIRWSMRRRSTNRAGR